MPDGPDDKYPPNFLPLMPRCEAIVSPGMDGEMDYAVLRMESHKLLVSQQLYDHLRSLSLIEVKHLLEKLRIKSSGLLTPALKRRYPRITI